MSASVRKMRLFTPMTPTMPRPCTVMRHVSSIDEMPLMALPCGFSVAWRITVPAASGLKVFFISIGMFLW